ncbi:MAG: pyrimidine reductase family protein [Micromonosporaceae bacterium]
MHLIWSSATAPDGGSRLDEAGLCDLYAPPRTRPWLRVNFVTSLDGAVEVDGYSRGLSGQPDQKVLGLLRQHCDALMVGAGTLRHEGYGPIRLDAQRRAWRREQGLAEIPPLVIVSAALDLDPTARVFTDAPVRPIVLTRAASASARQESLASVADVLVCGETVVDLAVGVAQLHERGLRQILCEGGPHLFGALLAAGLVDELCLTISPLLTGAGAGRIVAGVTRDVPLELELRHVVEADGLLLTRYARET